MECGRCGGDNPDDKRFCGDCGTPLRQACPACGTEAEPGKRFCGDCGAALTPPADAGTPAPPPLDPVAERRLCSVLFVDLVGFTATAEGRDPEEVRELLSRYFDVATTVVGRYGGTVEKFIGDAVMAVWGTPVATEEDAERAVRAAIDLVESIEQLGVDAGVPGLAARAGVLTGEVAVTLGASNEGMVAGDAVNTAARIQAAAATGTVYVDGATRRLTASAVNYTDVGEHHLKGKAEPEHLWRADRVVSAVGGAQRVDGLEAPLIGRSAELRAIREMFHATADRRQPRLMLITGPAGVGKSRLGWEFEKYTDGIAELMLWHRGRCLSYGDGLVYWALAEVVRRRLEIAEEDPPDVVATKLTDGLTRWIRDAAGREYIRPRLARLLGVAINDSPLSRDDLFAGWRRFFERLAADEPVVILIEDLHFAAPDLLDFLDHLVDWARDLPIFVLGFARPELESRRPGFGSGRNRVTIALDPLDTDSMDAIVDQLVPGMPVHARQAIVERAEGIPLYALESIRALIDRSVIVPTDGTYRLTGDIGELAVPDSLHALLAARLDALDPLPRRVVCDCAVLGVSFPAEAVAAVSGLPGDEAERVLAELVRREVLQVSADPRSPERGSYRFSQEMLRQVAYETLSRRDRKARHLAVAAHLRNVFPNDGEEVVDAIARHYCDALDAVPDDPDVADIRTLAIDTLVRAGERSRRSSTASAWASFVAAGDLVEPDDPLRAARLWIEACALLPLQLHDDVARIAARSREIYLAHGDHRGAALALAWSGRAVRWAGRYADSLPILEQAYAELGDEDSVERVDVSRLLSLALLVDGQQARSAELFEDGIRMAHQVGVDDELYARLLHAGGTCFDTIGDRRRAAMYLNEALRLLERRESRRDLADGLTNYANVLLVDDPAAALEAAHRAAAIETELGTLRTNGNTVIGNVMLAYLALGQWDAAERSVTDHDYMDFIGAFAPLQLAMLRALKGEPDEALLAAAATRINIEDTQDRAAFGTSQAFTALANGQLETALDHCLDVLGLVAADTWLSFAGDDGRWAWPLAARLAHDLGRYELETELLAQLAAQPHGTPAKLQRAEGELIGARLAAVDGAPDAGDRFVRAVAALRADSTPYHVAHGLLDHAAYLRGEGDEQHAAGLVAEAREIGERLPCRLIVERARQLEPAASQ